MKKFRYTLLWFFLVSPATVFSQFLEVHGLLEEEVSQYLVDSDLKDFGEGVWDQRYRMDMGGNWGMPFITSSDFGVNYASQARVDSVVQQGSDMQQETTNWRARLSLGLPSTRRFSIEPYVNGSQERLPSLADTAYRLNEFVWGFRGTLSLPWLPSYNADWRQEKTEISGLNSLSLRRRKEYNDRAVYKRGPLLAEYQHHWHESRDSLRPALLVDKAQDTFVTVNMTDSDLRRGWLENYVFLVDWRRWETGADFVVSGWQSNSNLRLRSKSFGPGALRNNIGLQETLAASQDSQTTVSHGLFFDSAFNRGLASMANGFQWTFADPGSGWSNNFNLQTRWLEDRLRLNLTSRETQSQAANGSTWRDQLTHRLESRFSKQWRVESVQDYRATRSLGGTQNQVIKYTGKVGWKPLASINLDMDYSFTEFQDMVRKVPARKSDSAGIFLQIMPLVGMTTSLRYWLNKNREVSLLTQSLEGKLSWNPTRSWRFSTGFNWGSQGDKITAPGFTTDRNNYFNYDAGIGYRIGKTDFNVTYQHDERDYSFGYHRFKASLRRLF